MTRDAVFYSASRFNVCFIKIPMVWNKISMAILLHIRWLGFPDEDKYKPILQSVTSYKHRLTCTHTQIHPFPHQTELMKLLERAAKHLQEISTSPVALNENDLDD